MVESRKHRRSIFVPSAPGSLTESTWPVSVDLAEKGDQIFVFVELPGVDKGDVTVSLRNNVLVIRGVKRPAEAAGTSVRYFCMERGCGRFHRELSLPFLVSVTNATALLTGGVLRISLNRLQERRGREYQIPVSGE